MSIERSTQAIQATLCRWDGFVSDGDEQLKRADRQEFGSRIRMLTGLSQEARVPSDLVLRAYQVWKDRYA